MSLLDDVSLMITPNGVSRNVLFGVLPTPTFSYEKIDLTSGATSEPSEWGSITTNGIKKLTSSATTYYETGFTVTTGKTYEASFTLSDYSGSSTMGFSNQGGVPSSIRLSGNGSVSGYFTATANAQLQLYGLSTNTGTFSNVSVKEVTTSDMDFTRATSATRVNPSGLVDGITTGLPRLDYRVSESCPHILVEPERTNICLRSEELDNASWTKSNGGTGSAPVVTANDIVSPDGTQNADKVVFDLNGGTALGDHSYLSQTYTQTADTYTISCYLKGASGGEKIFLDFDSANSNIATLTTDWVRYTFTKAVTSTGSTTIRIGLRGGVTSTDNPTIYMWGCQLEKAAYATSYIPTTSTSITRNGDRFTKKGISDLINSSEGVLYIEMAALVDAQTYRIISLSDGTEDQRVYIQYTNASQTVAGVIKRNGVTQANMSYTLTDETAFSKIAVKWKEDDFALWVDGTERGTDSAGNTPIGLNSLQFDNGKATAANFFYGKVRNLQLYKTALSDTQLGALTS